MSSYDLPLPRERVGFLTPAELDQVLTQSHANVECASHRSSKSALALALQFDGSLWIATHSNLRPQELGLIRSTHIEIDGDITLVNLHEHGRMQLKTPAARRKIALAGEAAARLTECKDRLGASAGKGPLFAALDHHDRREGIALTRARVNAALSSAVGEDCSLDTTRATWMRRAYAQLPSGTASLWPVRDFLAAAGHADIRTTCGWYIHDPVTLLSRLHVSGACTSQQVRWCLDCTQEYAARLLKKSVSWLRPETVVTESRAPVGIKLIQSEPDWLATDHPVDLTVADVATLMRLVAGGSTLTAACRALLLPDRIRNAVHEALEVLSSSGVALLEPRPDSILVRPPRHLPKRGLLRLALHDRKCWPALAWCFEQWLTVLAVAFVKGVPARHEQWARHITRDALLSQLPWRATKRHRAVVWRLGANEGRKQSDWTRFRWLSMAAWIHARVVHALGDWDCTNISDKM